ncbi:MAG: iron-sulfur cluster assembly scaffold protein [Rhodobacteraceae bacterium]|nr:iron-sulfur cluster assembly scaffold protein [Paracoccaceae bacterium]
MSGDSDLIKLYSTRILALAADIPHLTRLASPDGTARRRAPLCGSTVTVDLKLSDGVINAFGQDVKACALGQASASVFGTVSIGLDQATVARGRAELLAMLSQNAPPPGAPFEGMHVLEPAREFKNRHASILLVFDATLEAFAQAK